MVADTAVLEAFFMAQDVANILWMWQDVALMTAHRILHLLILISAVCTQCKSEMVAGPEGAAQPLTPMSLVRESGSFDRMEHGFLKEIRLGEFYKTHWYAIDLVITEWIR
jgi:hypothetical protein